MLMLSGKEDMQFRDVTDTDPVVRSTGKAVTLN